MEARGGVAGGGPPLRVGRRESETVKGRWAARPPSTRTWTIVLLLHRELDPAVLPRVHRRCRCRRPACPGHSPWWPAWRRRTPSSARRAFTASARCCDRRWLARRIAGVVGDGRPTSMRVPAGTCLIASAALPRMSSLVAEMFALPVSKWMIIRLSALTRSSALNWPGVSLARASEAACRRRWPPLRGGHG